MKSLVNYPTSFTNPEPPSEIDLKLTNTPYSFQNSFEIESGLSDFHKMVALVMKTNFNPNSSHIYSRARDQNEYKFTVSRRY